MATPTISPAAFTSVMGTGIVATAAQTLPIRVPELDGIALVFWLLDAIIFAAVAGATLAHYVTDRGAVRRYLLDPASAPFYGAMSMGVLSLGTATLVVGAHHIGMRAAVNLDLALWWTGTVLGVAAAAVVPALAFTRHRVAHDAASPVWLLPVVAPMVSAAGGALLIPHVSAAAAQTLALACYAQFGATVMATLAIVGSVWNRLALHQHTSAAAAPALFIVLGPLGQSTTAAGLLADHAPSTLGVSTGAMTSFSILYGVPVMGFALLWLAIAAIIVTGAARAGMPFTLGWWAFTFPLGTCVTGATVLAQHTGAAAFEWLAVAWYVLLLFGWSLAAAGTARLLATRALSWREHRERALSPAVG